MTNLLVNIWVSHKKVNSKKYFPLLVIGLIIFAVLLSSNIVIGQDMEVSNTQADELYNATFELLDDIDLSKLEEVLKELDNGEIATGSVKDTIMDILAGKFDINADNLFSYIFSILSKNIRGILPVCVAILVISIILRILSSFSPNVFKDGVMELINYISMGVVVILLGKYILSVNYMIQSVTNSMQTTLNVIFPILLTLMGGLGATSSVAIYSPITTILNTTVSTIISKFLYPIYLISFALIIISVVSSRVKVNKLIEFLSSLFKTSLAFIFTVFSGIFAIKGMSAGKYDSVGIFTTKFAVKNYIPLIGSYISEGFNYIILSSQLVKNAIGLAGIILILSAIITPVIYLLVLKLVLKLTSSLCEMIGDAKLSGLLDKCSKISAYPIAIILGVAFMFIMSLGLVMSTANLI